MAAEHSSLLADRYLLGDIIGRGGMADVHRGTDQVLGREVAVKILRDRAGDPTDRARFTAEARTLAGLSHPGLVIILDAGFDAERPYLVMELVEGSTLASQLASGPLEVDVVGRVGADLASALAYAHDQGIVHRDVKPGNVLLGAAGRVKLADFGIARLIGDTVRHTQTGQAIGTPAYLAPEQVRGDEITPAVDVYSLGLVLLEALTAERAYQGSATELALARLSASPPIPGWLHPSWRSLLSAATATRPEERPDAATVAERLRALASGPTVDRPDVTRVMTAPPAPASDSPRQRALTWLRARPSEQRGIAAALAGIIVLLVVAMFAAGGDDEPPPAGDAPSQTPPRLKAPLDDLHDAINGVGE